MTAFVPTVATSLRSIDFFDDIEKVFQSFFSHVPDHYPVSNVYLEDGTQDLVFEIAITGFKKDEIEVNVNDGKLIINGKKESLDDSDGKRYITRKIAMRDFSKKYIIPNGYDVSTIDASIADGVLKITIKKKEEDVRKVDIKYIA